MEVCAVELTCFGIVCEADRVIREAFKRKGYGVDELPNTIPVMLRMRFCL